MSNYTPETVGSIMATNVPTCQPDNTKADILSILSGKTWQSVHNVYVLEGKKLLGVIHTNKLLGAKIDTQADDLMKSVTETLHVSDDQEKAVYLAIKDDIIAIPVLDSKDNFAGAVTAHSLVDIMHDEHIEDTLITAGIHGKGSSIVRLASERVILVVKSRAPWLVFGLTIGLGLGFISSLFEESLKNTVAIAFFIPAVAYIADSVGSQSVAIAVRAIATLKINRAAYLARELMVGIALGVLVGILGGIGATLISQSISVGMVVALSLFVASSVAAVLASSMPMLFKLLGKDPALGSGPIATAFQDSISVTVYFLFAAWFL